MSVVELGTHQMRAGYIGDATCTRCVPALRSTAAPGEVDLFSVLYAASRRLEPAEVHSTAATLHVNEEQPRNTDNSSPVFHSADSGASRDDAVLMPLWSLRQFEQYPAHHLDSLRRLKRDVLQCAEADPLCLIVPETWHERLDVMEALFQLVLETPGIATALYCVRPSVAWTLASGAASSLVLDVGHSHSTVTAVVDGYALRQSVASISVGGDAVTAQYADVLKKHRPAVEATATRLPPGIAREYFWHDWVSNVKHAVSRVLPAHLAKNESSSTAVSLPSSVKTGVPSAQRSAAAGALDVIDDLQAPDGTRVHLDEHRAALPFEVLFRGATTTITTVDDTSSHKRNVVSLLVECKRRMDPEWQLHTIPHLLAGAGSRVPGFKERIVEELKAQDASYFRYERDGAVRVASSTDGAWIGASMAASSSSFEPLWVTRGEWAEEGAAVIHRKLFY